jgi:hypothetical protein
MPRLIAAVVLATVVAVPAAAQSSDPARTHAIGAGAQWGSPYSGARMTAGMQASWQSWFGPHFGAGAHVRWKTLQTTRVATAPGLETRDEDRRSSYGFGMGLLGRIPAGRLSLIAGAGPGVFVDRRAHESLLNGTKHSGSETIRSIGLQGVMEIDVRVTDHLSAFAALHIEWRELRSAESSSGYPAAGVRVVF